MSIVQRTETYGGTEFLYTYSDANMLIKQEETGKIYTDALDVPSAGYTYTETDQPADPDRDAPSDADVYAEAGRILLGEM